MRHRPIKKTRSLPSIRSSDRQPDGGDLNNEPQGWVISFRSKDDINTLSLQLSQVQQYADNLRAVQHEHRNLISTIAGLLFLKRYNKRWN
ncbi:signal transduction histidine kinase regulating citrate/malate metabolism [Klebsiella pneumoniae]|uniref:Signal transduction histidine kinase regulating citrate/malate metabolism n=1 Tax=Klebsiella pneumoniae TaxID=573 RepID=A0A2X3IK02_KLEPN|nr:signal transduction histidine kinase regulating citrate/malate metabolism [Klebsiella pneumoniae]